MTVTRGNVEFAKKVFADRLDAPYVYGGKYDPLNPRIGTDCSGLVGDELDAVNLGAAMPWQRSVSTESWPYDYVNNRAVPPGTAGPKGTIAVASLADVPADAAVIVNIHHGGGGADSHTQCIVDGVVMESNGSHGTCTSGGGAMDPNSTYWTDHWYLPGPIVEDGTPVTVIEPPDTLFADVSEWQVPVTDSYPYRVLSIRSNDGTYRDKNFNINYPWMRRALDDGRLSAGIVYFVWRPNWQDAIATLTAQINLNSGLHPKVAIMIDVESWGGQITGDQSAGINAAFNAVADWIGDRRRVIGYGNTGDLNALWRTKPDGVRLVVAGYGQNPAYPGKIAHQYTDGQGYGGGLPEGADPFGRCDMNSADGYTATAFAAALGITTGTPVPPSPSDPMGDLLMMEFESISPFATPGEPQIPADVMLRNADGASHRALVLGDAEYGDPDAIFRMVRAARGQDSKYTDASSVQRWRWQLRRFIRDTAVYAAQGDPTAVGILQHLQDHYPDALQDFVLSRKGA